MAALLNRVKHVWVGEEAATAAEYALILAFIVVTAWLAMEAFGTNVRGLAHSLNQDITAATTETQQVRFLEVGRDNTI